MKKTIIHSNPFKFSWDYCLKSGKGKKTAYKTLLHGEKTTTDFYSVYADAKEEADKHGIKKSDEILLKCYLMPEEGSMLDLYRIALHAAKIVSGAKKFQGNKSIDRISAECNYILSRISGEEECGSDIALELLDRVVLHAGHDTRYFVQIALDTAWIHRGDTPEIMYKAIYSELHNFLNSEKKYNINCKASDFDDLEVLTASAFLVGLPEKSISSMDEKVLNDAIASLPYKQKAYITLHYEGYADSEIAKKFDTTSDAISTGRRKAQKNILDYIADKKPDLLNKVDYKAVYTSSAKTGNKTAEKNLHDIAVNNNKYTIMPDVSESETDALKIAERLINDTIKSLLKI